MDAVLSRPDIDAVVVNATTAQHTDILSAAATQGKHIFTEKALTITTDEADKVIEAVKNSDIKFMISLPRRTFPEVLFLKQALDAGWLGRVTLMRARLAHDGALRRRFDDPNYAWFGNEEQAGGGALFDLGCHTVDVMRWFLGEPASVIAKIHNFSGAYDIDDQAAVVVTFKNGALGILDTSWVQKAGPTPIEIYGTEGYAGYGGRGEPVKLASNLVQPEGIQGTIIPSQLPQSPPSPMTQWISAILNDTPMTITIDDGRNLTQLLEGIYNAGRTGQEVFF